MSEQSGERRGTYGLTQQRGRRRKPEAPTVVTVVLRSGEQAVLPSGSPLARAISSLAGLLAAW